MTASFCPAGVSSWSNKLRMSSPLSPESAALCDESGAQYFGGVLFGVA